MHRIFLTLFLSFVLLKANAQTCSIVSSDIVCKEELMTFDVTASAGISSVTWDMGDATTSTQKTFSHKYSTKGVKNVIVIIKLTGGGSCTASKQVTVYELPQFKLGLKSDNIYCLSQNRVCFIDSSTGGDAGINITKRIILWDDGDQTSTPNPVMGKEICHKYANTGTFKVTIELTNDKDCKAKKVIDIKILPDVIPKFTVSGGHGCDSARLIMEDVNKKDTSEIVERIYDWGDG
ncbi:MAG: PKD domain-containing protein, partial [Bacteroidia bacterium]